jgi:hypothetical protein
LIHKTVGPGGLIAALAAVSREFFADGRLAESYGLRDPALVLYCLIHVGDHHKVFRTEVVVFVIHSQLVVKSE